MCPYKFSVVPFWRLKAYYPRNRVSRKRTKKSARGLEWPDRYGVVLSVQPAWWNPAQINILLSARAHTHSAPRHTEKDGAFEPSWHGDWLQAQAVFVSPSVIRTKQMLCVRVCVCVAFVHKRLGQKRATEGNVGQMKLKEAELIYVTVMARRNEDVRVQHLDPPMHPGWRSIAVTPHHIRPECQLRSPPASVPWTWPASSSGKGGRKRRKNKKKVDFFFFEWCRVLEV